MAGGRAVAVVANAAAADDAVVPAAVGPGGQGEDVELDADHPAVLLATDMDDTVSGDALPAPVSVADQGTVHSTDDDAKVPAATGTDGAAARGGWGAPFRRLNNRVAPERVPAATATTTARSGARGSQAGLLARDTTAAGYDSDEEVVGRHRRAQVTAVKARALPEQYRQYIQQSWLEIRRNKCHYAIGCTSVFLVVFVVAAALSILNYSSVLFLGLAESNQGEIDMTLYPSNKYFWPTYINYTALTTLVAANGTADMTWTVPRHELYGSSYALSACAGAQGTASMDWSYFQVGNTTDPNCTREPSHCVNYNCPVGVDTRMQLVDSVREKQIGLGRTWPYPPVPADACYITASLARGLRVNVGDTLLFSYMYALPRNAHVAVARACVSPSVPRGQPVFVFECLFVGVRVPASVFVCCTVNISIFESVTGS
jgi:hypothetical protein